MDKPTHWCLGWSGNLELGFDDGKYLPRKAALILYPEYFNESSEPKLDMLPIDSLELAEKRKKRKKKWWNRWLNQIQRLDIGRKILKNFLHA